MSRQSAWVGERTEALKRLWSANERVAVIANQFGVTPAAIYMKASQLGLSRRAKPARTAKRQYRRREVKPDTTGQRRFAGLAHGEEDNARVILAPFHPASRGGATIFPSTVRPASAMVHVLKGGENSRKLGGVVAKGQWKGMPIFMLTLEERHTCPRSCLEWAHCYGNNMHMAQRVSDDGTLTRRLFGELASLNAKHPSGFLVRLHILGDFYSVEYVEFWRQSLADFHALRVFGFSARQAGDPIGRAVIELIRDEPDRFKVRISGAGYETHCSEVVASADAATGVLCPAQSDAERSCATCALCWQSDRTISFVRH